MEKFYSLREFLLLKDPSYDDGRSIHRIIDRAENFVKLYEIAKASWEKYGDSGPPIGCTVMTLVAGHGGLGGDIRKFKGDSGCAGYFAISRLIRNYNGCSEEAISLVNKEFWWLEIKVVED